MKCLRCGNENDVNAVYCSACGSRLDSREGLSEPELPEGIVMDEQGAFHWIYHLDMKRNPVILVLILKIMFLICAGIGLFEAVLLLVDGRSFGEVFRALLIIVIGIGGLMMVLAWISWLILMKIRGGIYTVEHLMCEDRIEYLQTPEEQETSEKIKTAAFAFSLLADSPGAASASISGTEHMVSSFAEVRSLERDPKHDLIKVNNLLQHNQIYAYPHQYEFVWDYINYRCANAKIRE